MEAEGLISMCQVRICVSSGIIRPCVKNELLIVWGRIFKLRVRYFYQVGMLCKLNILQLIVMEITVTR